MIMNKLDFHILFYLSDSVCSIFSGVGKFCSAHGSRQLIRNTQIDVILEIIFLTRELSLINTSCWRADHEILMHDGGAGVH